MGVDELREAGKDGRRLSITHVCTPPPPPHASSPGVEHVCSACIQTSRLSMLMQPEAGRLV